MPAGRPATKLKHIEQVEGSSEAKLRMTMIVRTLSGEITVGKACERLRIGSSRFHVIRHEALQAAVERLEPRASGRPPREADPDRVRALEAQLAVLETEVRHERARAGIAVAASSAKWVRGRGLQSRSG